MTNEEAIEALRDAQLEYPRKDFDRARALAINELEKGIPERIRENKDLKVGMFCCPSCGKIYFYQTFVNNCDNCGQSLEWSDDL